MGVCALSRKTSNNQPGRLRFWEAVALWLSLGLAACESPAAPQGKPVTPAAVVAADAATPAQPSEPPPLPEPTALVTELPPLGTRAQSRTWLRMKYGPGERQLGIDVPRVGEVLPPQGFAATRDGNLLVLDSAKQRLVWFALDGTFERALALPKDAMLYPSDVAIARDGTIAVIDGPHQRESQGMVLLDADGRQKGAIPIRLSGADTLYAVGDQFFSAVEGKRGDAQGHRDSATPHLYAYPNSLDSPIAVGPDGQTTVDIGKRVHPGGDTFFVRAIRGPRAELVFARTYRFPYDTAHLKKNEDGAIPFAHFDDQGRLYVVLFLNYGESLVCLDGRTGEPQGFVRLPKATNGGTQQRIYGVVPGGGLVVQRGTLREVSYTWVNCF